MKNCLKKAALLVLSLAIICSFSFGTFSKLFTDVSKVNAAGGKMTVYGIYLGGKPGDSVLVESNGKYLLMDLGDSTKDQGGTSSGAYKYVKAFLQDRGVTELSLYYSHFHTDHTGGVSPDGALATLMNDFKVDKVYVPDIKIFGKYENQITEYYQGNMGGIIARCEGNGSTNKYKNDKNENTEIIYLAPSGITNASTNPKNTFTFGDVTATVLGPQNASSFTGPSAEDEADGDFANNASLVTMLKAGNVKYLSTGDIKEEAEKTLLAKYKNGELDADIYKIAHHGITGNTEDFVKAVSPKCSFACDGNFTGTREYGDNGKKRKETFLAKQETSKYGLSFMVADETMSFVAETLDGTNVKMYKYDTYKNGGPSLTGIVKTVGSYGVNYAGGSKLCYDFHDYYYLDSNGNPITGLQTVTVEGVKGLRYFGPGGLLYNSFWGWEGSEFIYKKWEQFDEKKNYWRCYDRTTATILTGRQDLDDGTYYFDKTDGHRLTGIQKIGDDTYRFTDGGKMEKSAWYNDNKNNDKNHWMYFNSNGKRLYGWQSIKGVKYYFDLTTGYRKTGIQTIDNATYRFADGGGMATGWYNDTSNNDKKHWMYFGDDGKRVTGWKKIDGKKYYLDKKTGYRKVGLQEIDGATYRFADGGGIATGWYNDTKNNDKKHWMYFGDDGKRLTGWQKIKGTKYYLDKKTGYRKVGVQKIDGAVYRFADGGGMATGWYNDTKKNDKKHWMYFASNGKRLAGWQTIAKEKYYLDEETGYRATGIIQIGKGYYYFSDGGKSVFNRAVKLDGYQCKFDKNGKLKNVPKVAATKFTTAKSPSAKQATFTWKKNKKATGYEIFMSDSKKGTYKSIATIKKPDTVTYTKKGLKSGKKCYFKVVAYQQIAGCKFYSKDSSIKEIKIK